MSESRAKNRWAMVEQSLLSLFITFSLIELTNRGAAVIDGLFVSIFLGPDALASVGVVKMINHVIGIVSGILAIGMQSRCSHELGSGNLTGFNRIFSSMFYLSVIVSVFCMIIVILSARPLAVLMGASGNGAGLAEDSAAYLRGMGIGFPSIVIAVVMSVACQLDNAKTRVRISSFINLISNCIFDYIAIKNNMGVFGIGLATALAKYLQVGFLLLHFLKKDRMLCFTRFTMSFREITETLSLGTEKSLRSLGKVISPIILNRIVLFYGGSIAMSAFAVQNDLIDITEIFSAGLADAVALQAGIYYGERNKEALHAMGKAVHKLCAVFLGGMGAVLILLSRPIAMLYISERGKLFDMVVFSSVLIGIYAPLNGLVRSRLSYLNAIKKAHEMQIMTFLSSVVYTFLCAFVLSGLFGEYGALASNLMLTILLLLTVYIYHAVKSKRCVPCPDDYLALPACFDIGPGDLISLDIRNTDDVSIVAEQIQLFCKYHNIDSSTSIRIAVCFEELSTNIMKFGFPRRKKKPYIDFRLVYADDELVMRLRDNCPIFNVEHYNAQKTIFSENENEAQLGLKLVFGLADNIKYVYSLETNNVIVRFPVRISTGRV